MSEIAAAIDKLALVIAMGEIVFVLTVATAALVISAAIRARGGEG